MPSKLRIEILKFILSEEKDFTIRQIARELNTTSSHVFYHIKKMGKKGIITKEKIGGRIYYEPQPIFLRENVEATMQMIKEISKHIHDPDNQRIATCIETFLELYPE